MKIHGKDYELEVRVNLQFHASHALPIRPELHSHRWDVEMSVSGPLNPKTGMVCDMLELSEFLKPFVEALDNVNLHDFPDFQNQDGLLGITAKYPTCDTLAHYFVWKINPEFERDPRFKDVRISQIKISIFEEDGEEAWGHAMIRPT